MSDQLKKRLKSFGWRTLVMSLVAGLSWASANIGLLEIPVWAQTVVGLGAGEITKWLNTHKDIFGAFRA